MTDTVDTVTTTAVNIIITIALFVIIRNIIIDMTDIKILTIITDTTVTIAASIIPISTI